MRLWVPAAVFVLLVGCAHPGGRPPAPSAGASASHVDPSNIRRVRRELPPGYEVALVTNITVPQDIWGLGGTGVAAPARCATLADPADGHAPRAQGISGSGTGGTVFAIVSATPAGGRAPDGSLVAQCRQWSVTGRRVSAHVRLIDAPHIDAAETVGLAAEIVTSVEGGNEITTQASIFTAYLDGYYAFTTVISDPGSADLALTPEFAADLLVKTVAALRG